MLVAHDLPDLACVRRINESSHADELYVAVRVSDGAEVAVRVYQQTLGTTRDRARFDNEVAALQALNGEPHILTIHEAGLSAAGQPFVAMEFCPNGSLQDHLTNVGRFTPAEVRGIGVKLATALTTAHERKAYHRNLKPANILIDHDGQPALADFRLVTLSTSNGDFSPAMPTRPRAYVAPEAFLPELMTVADDIYSLGATLYALLAGWAPRAVDPFAIAVDGDNVADLPRVPWVLMTVLQRAMALDPRDRYADAEQMRAALAGEP